MEGQEKKKDRPYKHDPFVDSDMPDYSGLDSMATLKGMGMSPRMRYI